MEENKDIPLDRDLTTEEFNAFKKSQEEEIAKMRLIQDVEIYSQGVQEVVKMMKVAEPKDRDNLMTELKTLKQELTYKYAMLKALNGQQ